VDKKNFLQITVKLSYWT